MLCPAITVDIYIVVKRIARENLTELLESSEIASKNKIKQDEKRILKALKIAFVISKNPISYLKAKMMLEIAFNLEILLIFDFDLLIKCVNLACRIQYFVSNFPSCWKVGI
ncbi:hypothetical protein ABPG74_016249 [Tetrahymena malaccensis]